MNVELVRYSDNVIIPKSILPDNGQPFSHHFRSTRLDNLIELAGRVCYDSCKNEKSRSSKDYHQHINDVNHGSVQEHAQFVVNMRVHKPSYLSQIMFALWKVPGFDVIDFDNEQNIILIFNLRSVNDFFKFNKLNTLNNRLHNDFVEFTEYFTPQAIRYEHDASLEPLVTITPHSTEIEVGNFTPITFYIQGISRSCSHEHIRHRFGCAISQRSTRYVDESESDFAEHPHFNLLSDKIKELWKGNHLLSQWTYNYTVQDLESKLAEKVDKLTARKQARGVARGILGNALETEMIWTTNVFALEKFILPQRCSDAADAEIRLLFNKVYEVARANGIPIIIPPTQSAKDSVGFVIP